MLGDVYDKAILELSRQQPDQLPWTDPSKISEGTRKALEMTAKDIPPDDDVKRKLAAAKQSMFSAIGLNPLTPAVLLKDDAGAWNVYTAATALDGTTVWTIKPQAGASTQGDATDQGVASERREDAAGKTVARSGSAW